MDTDSLPSAQNTTNQGETSLDPFAQAIANRFSMGLGDRRWHTRGRPIWSSPASGKFIALKTVWRSGTQKVHDLVNEHPGVAQYNFGADVVFPDTGRSINLTALRGGDSETGAICSPTLHRLIFSSLGKPVWEYGSELELSKGIRAALKGGSYIAATY